MQLQRNSALPLQRCHEVDLKLLELFKPKGYVMPNFLSLVVPVAEIATGDEESGRRTKKAN